MDRDRDLFLFVAFCLQTGRIDSEQFAAVWRLCAERPDKAVGDVLAERGWLQPVDRPHLQYLLDRYLHEHGDNARAATTHLLAAARQSLISLETLASESTVAYSPTSSADPQPSGATSPAAMDARYAFTSIHATGGMGRVWRACDRQLDREVALKELRPEHAGNSKTAARFIREARLTG